MSADGYLPPGTSERDVALDAYYLRCIGCGRDLPAGELGEEELCARCREEGEETETKGEP